MKIQIIARNSGEMVTTVEMPVVPQVGDSLVVKGKGQIYIHEGKISTVKTVKEYVVRSRRFFIHCDVEKIQTAEGGWVVVDGGHAGSTVLLCDTKEDFVRELKSVDMESKD